LDQSLAARVVVRVYGRTGVVGAGFLIGPDLVATCAHVVAEALAADPYGPPPQGRVRIDLPLFIAAGADEPSAMDAEVVRWQPIGADGSGDVAVLRVRGPLPPGARMPPVRRVDRLWDHRFRVLGFPDGLTDGVWATGLIRGEQGTRWFQLQAAAGEQPIVGGFSGSPVWDEDSGAVVGMTVAADTAGTTTAYLLPIDQVLGVDPELLPCPYRGLEPFGEEHAAFYFGRDTSVAELAAAVAEHPLVAVTGPSGAGKSSLVRAGLLPRLRAGGARVVELRPVPGAPPGHSLQLALPPGTVPPELAGPARRPGDVRALAAALADPPTVLVADQFEELAATDPDGAQALLQLVTELVTALPRRADGSWPVRAVLTLRSATIDEVLVPGVATLLGAGTVLLPPMERGQLREAIVAPAERAPGLTFEPGLVDRILDDAAAEPGGLPLVESLLTNLWEHRHGGMLTLEAYERAGGVAGVVATHAESVVGPFTATEAEPRVRRLLTSLAGPDRDGRFVRRPQRVADLAPDVTALIAPLAAGRLIVVEDVAGHGDRVQLAHQALIAHWPRLRGWLDEDSAFLSWRDQLDQLRDRWETTHRDDGALLRGTGLATAQEWVQRRAWDVSAPAREFVERSRRRQRREVRRWRTVTAVLAVLTFVASAFGAVTVISRNQLGEQLRLANAELLGQAALARMGDPGTAAVLALAGWQADPDNAAVRTALMRLAMGTRSVSALHVDLTTIPSTGFAMSEDGMVLAMHDGGSVVVLLGLPTGRVERWEAPGAQAGQVRVSPDGRWLAVRDADGAVALWDVTARTGPVRIPESGDRPAATGTVAFAPGSDRLSWVTRSPSGSWELMIWDLTRRVAAPHSMGSVAAPTALTADPATAVEVDGENSQITTRSLADGSVVFHHPPPTRRAGEGLVITCAPGEQGVALVREETGADVRRIRMLGERCDGELLHSRLSVDGLHLVEPRATGAERDVDAFRITSLADGATFELVAPPNPLGAPGEFGDVSRFTGVLPGPGGGRTVLMARGRSVITLQATPDIGGRLADHPTIAALTEDRRHVVVAGDHITVLDAATGTPLSELTTSDLPGEPSDINIADDVTMLIAAAAGWSYHEFDVPSLTERLRVELPRLVGEPRRERAEVTTTDERISTLHDGLLATWDHETGATVGKPIDLGSTAERAARFRDGGVFDLRPGAVPQVAVHAGSGVVELWNPATGAVDGVLRTAAARAPSAMSFDRTGTRLVVFGLDATIEVWDVDRRVPIGPPIWIGDVPAIKGFAADGYLWLVQEQAGGPDRFRLTAWGLGSGRQSGSVRLSAVHDPVHEVAADGRSLRINGRDGAMPFAFPVTADGWVEQLCRFADRPFTAEERLLMPAGSGTEEPCPRS
jgi:WD40 repeat protein